MGKMPKQGKELILAYNLKDSPKAKGLVMACMILGIRVKAVEPGQYLQPLGALCGLNGIEPVDEIYEGEGLDEEMLVLHDFSSARMDQLFQQLRRVGVGRIALKAALTETNCTWNSLELYQEIKKEHEYMQGQR